MHTKLLIKRICCCIAIFFVPLHASARAVSDDSQSVAELKQAVQKDLQEQKPQLAIPLLRKIIAIEPTDTDATGNLGVLLFFEGNYPDAITAMHAALQLQPDLWKIQALLGIAEKRIGDPSAAQTDLEKAFTNLDDKNIQKEAGLELIELASATGRLDKAAAVAATLENLEPQDPQILFAAYEVSLQMIDQTLLDMTIAAPNSAEMHMMMANQFKSRGDTRNAIAQYREALRLNPRVPGAHFELAEQLNSSSDATLHAEAEGEFKAAITANPYDEKALRELGEIAAAKGNLQMAREDFRKALSLQPGDSDAETDLAKTLTSPDETKEAISHLENAIRNDPTNIVAHYWLSSFYRQMGRTADAKRQMDECLHYKQLKENLRTAFQQMRTEPDPTKSAGVDKKP
jgi:tetratricopeptide (TPR) repeat protein